MNFKLFGRKRFRGIIEVLPWRKITTSGKVENIPAEIRTEHLPNTSLDRYRYTSLLGSYK
jgi:hypothetical protein